MSVTINSALQRAVIMEGALQAFKKRLLALNVFSTSFQRVALEGTDKMEVPYYPLETSTSVDWNGTNGYVFGDAYTVGVKEVTINKRKYQPLSASSSSIARQPQMNLAAIGEQKGNKLANDVFADILSDITAANFGAAVFTGAATAFDFVALNETIGTACDVAEWPDELRAVVLKSAYYRNLVTELKDASSYASDNPVKRGVLEDVAGFDLHKTNNIPANAQNLVGFVAHKSAKLIGFSPIMPADGGSTVEYQIIADEETGIALEYRKWFDPQLDQLNEVIECNYGYAPGEAAGLKRIVSA
jgi:hypothetical protein